MVRDGSVLRRVVERGGALRPQQRRAHELLPRRVLDLIPLAREQLRRLLEKRPVHAAEEAVALVRRVVDRARCRGLPSGRGDEGVLRRVLLHALPDVRAREGPLRQEHRMALRQVLALHKDDVDPRERRAERRHDVQVEPLRVGGEEAHGELRRDHRHDVVAAHNGDHFAVAAPLQALDAPREAHLGRREVRERGVAADEGALHHGRVLERVVVHLEQARAAAHG
mmetsp:Transcript_35954/g.110777  ORF Transcript_35954/g.110777 Transcript_35954/m.110777 type:complete len:225 (-) Transcript_35954:858-1532(-)